MKRWLLLVLLCACGGKKDDNKPAGEVAATVKKPATPLAEAKQLLAAQRKRNPEEWVALAHAQAVAKDPAAKQTLDDALSAAGSDQLDGPAALVLATDVLILLGDTTNTQKLLDEGIAGLKAHNFPEDKLATLLSPVHDIQNPEALKRLAHAGIVEAKKTDAVIARMRPSGPAWDAVVEAVAALDPHERGSAYIALARRSRRAGAPAPQLANRGVGYMMDGSDEWIEQARELALSNDATAAKALVAKAEKDARSQEAARRAQTYADLAELAMILGDAKGSEAYEKKALQAAEVAHDDLEEDDGFGGKAGDALWSALAVARARRKDLPGAVALVTDHLKGEAIGEVAYLLVEQGDRDAAPRFIELTKGEEQFDLIADIVELEAERGELEQAKQRMLAAPLHEGERPGIDHVLRQYALAGDVKAVRELVGQGAFRNMQLDAFTDLAARMLARQNKCDEAIAAMKDVVLNRAECLAVVARYCPTR
jgi:hypothetical protein